MEFDIEAMCIDHNNFPYTLKISGLIKWIFINNINTQNAHVDKCFPCSKFLQFSYLDKKNNKLSKSNEFHI